MGGSYPLVIVLVNDLGLTVIEMDKNLVFDALEGDQSRILKPQIDNVNIESKGSKINSWSNHPLMKGRSSRKPEQDKTDASIQTEEECDEVTEEDILSDNPSRAYWKHEANEKLKSLEETREKSYELS